MEYTKPEIEIIWLPMADIITTSAKSEYETELDWIVIPTIEP